jgi:hypothetical protein
MTRPQRRPACVSGARTGDALAVCSSASLVFITKRNAVEWMESAGTALWGQCRVAVSRRGKGSACAWWREERNGVE